MTNHNFSSEEKILAQTVIDKLESVSIFYEELTRHPLAGWDYSRIMEVLDLVNGQINGWKNRHRI